MSDETKKDTMVVIDVSALAGNTQEMMVDPTANAFARQNPVDDARYKATITLPSDEKRRKEALQERTINKPESKFHNQKWWKILADIKLTEFAGPGDNNSLLGKSRTFEVEFTSFERMDNGKPTSEIATALVAMGAQLPAGKVQTAQLVAALFNAIAAGGMIGVETEWVAAAKTGKKEKGADGKEYDVYKTVKRGQKNFPKDAEGHFDPEFTTADGQQVRARAEIKGYFRVA